MLANVDTSDPAAVEREVERLRSSMFGSGRSGVVSRVFSWARDSFEGRRPGYLPIDARYHDFEHTLQGTLCMARLLAGRHRDGAEPVLDEEAFAMGLAAILLHDTGYLKRTGDDYGTGAKYTLTHVHRSAEFAEALLLENGYTPGAVRAVQNMISCTGVDVDLGRVPFRNPVERTLGFALGTSDLLGQMAASDYIEKLPILYDEFREAADFNQQDSSAIVFQSAEDLIRKTPGFWRHYVLPKIENDFGGLYRHLTDDAGRNPYIDGIEDNIARLEDRLASARR